MEVDLNYSAPLFSVIIPTFNRPEELRACLRALGRQSFAGRFEVIVVNDGGSPLPDLVSEASRLPRFRMLEQSNSGPGAARNFGASHAGGVFLAFTDDDCEPAPDWLTELARGLEADPSAVVGGRVVNALADNAGATASQLLLDLLYAQYRRDDAPQFFTSNNIAVARQAFLDLGGFDESFSLPAAEDRELCSRWRRSRGRLHYAPAAVVRHSHDLGLANFLSQHFRYGRGAWQLRTKEAGLGERAPRIEPLMFYCNLLFCPFKARRGNVVQQCQQAALLGISQVAHTAGFFRQRWGPSHDARRPAAQTESPARE